MFSFIGVFGWFCGFDFGFCCRYGCWFFFFVLVGWCVVEEVLWSDVVVGDCFFDVSYDFSFFFVVEIICLFL